MKPTTCPNCHKTCVPKDGFCPYCHSEVDTTASDKMLAENPLKITCEFCGSYIEPDGSNCPSCGAPLGESLKIQEEKRAKAQLRLKEKEEEKQRLKEQREKEDRENEQIMRTIGNIVTGVTRSSGINFHPFRKIKYFFRRLGKKLQAILAVIGLLALFILLYKLGILENLHFPAPI